MRSTPLLVLLLLACGGSGGEEAPASLVVPVALDTLRRDSISVTLALVGRLAPAPGGSAALTAPMDAVVRRVAHGVGDRVGAGEVLIDLDAPELAGQAAALRAQADATTANAVRQRRLLLEGLAARRSVEEQEALATSAEAAARAAEALLSRSRLVAPLSGTVAQLLVQPGERVSAGQSLGAVVNDAALDLVAAVPATDLAALQPGQHVAVLVEGSATPEAGQIRAIAPALDTNTNAAKVLVRMSHAGGRLRAGAAAEGQVTLSLHRDVLVVPDSALVLIGNGYQLFVVGQDSIARGHDVVIVTRAGGRVEISGDLQAGQVIVSGGAYGLSDSIRVTQRVAAP